MDDLKYTVVPVFGHKVLRAWIEVRGEQYVGMASVTTYDGDGKLIDVKTEPTGLVGRFS